MALTSVIRQSRVTRDVSKQFADRPEARLEYLLALRRCTNGAAAEFLSDPSPAIVLEAARAINDVPILEAQSSLAALAEPTALDRLSVPFKAWQAELARQTPVAEPGVIRDVRADQPLPWGTAPIDEWTPLLLRVVNANFRLGTTESAHRLAMLAVRSDLPDLIRTEAVFALGTWAKPHPRDRVVGVYRPLGSRDSSAAKQAFAEVMPHLFGRSSTEAVQVAAAEAATRLSIEAAEGACLELLRYTGATAQARAAALRTLVALKATTVSQALEIALKDSEEVLRLEGSRINAELHPENAAAQLSAKLLSGTVAEQQGAFAALGDLKSDAADAILADWLDRLMRREVANEVMLDLVEAAGKRSASAVKMRLEAYGRWKLPQDHLTPYREALYGGDAVKGKKIFYENAAVACTRCHHIGADGGGNAGPVLDGVATRQPREYLLENIVFPNQQIAAGFETATVTMKNGTPYSGTVKGETDSQLILLSPEDGEIKLEKSGIQERAKGLSGMPEGLVQFLSRQELRDVVAFLSTLK